MQSTPGWAYWVYVVHLQTTLLLSSMLCFWRAPHLKQRQMKQYTVLVFAICAGLITHLLRLLLLANLPLDLTALTLGFFTINALWYLPDDEMLDLIHLSGRHLLQNLKEPVVLLDAEKNCSMLIPRRARFFNGARLPLAHHRANGGCSNPPSALPFKIHKPPPSRLPFISSNGNSPFRPSTFKQISVPVTCCCCTM